MPTPHSKDKLIGKILKLFSLGAKGSGTNEAEMMSAITQAKVMMARHDISEAEIRDAADRANEKADTKVEYDIGSYTAYTRKMKSLARYDEVVAVCVGHLTSTNPILTRYSTARGPYVSMKFVGTEMDVAVAAKLFMIFLQSVRARAREQFGSDKWSRAHTSYAIGFATRMNDRAMRMAEELTPQEQTSTALIVQSKTSAIARWMADQEVSQGTRRKSKLDTGAFTLGYIHGEKFNLGKTGLE